MYFTNVLYPKGKFSLTVMDLSDIDHLREMVRMEPILRLSAMNCTNLVKNSWAMDKISMKHIQYFFYCCV